MFACLREIHFFARRRAVERPAAFNIKRRASASESLRVDHQHFSADRLISRIRECRRSKERSPMRNGGSTDRSCSRALRKRALFKRCTMYDVCTWEPRMLRGYLNSSDTIHRYGHHRRRRVPETNNRPRNSPTPQ
jgi:hypothetical protein